jgi:tRNA-specific 2-thiouridylase
MRIVLAMSGGVDSSVAAHLLREHGHDVIGVFMRHGEASAVACAADENSGAPGGRIGGTSESSTSLLPVVSTRLDHKQGCCSAADAEDARRVADRLGIPFYALDFQEEFGRIIDYFVEEYTAARTPNPCIMCNNWLKFGKLFDFADSVGAEYVATGHYARVQGSGFRVQEESPKSQVPSPKSKTDWQPASTWDLGPGTWDLGPETHPRPETWDQNNGPPKLLRGVDEGKDQSYVLFGIERRFLERMLLPVGGYRKAEIRAIAAEIGLRVADKRDSQEICFVTSGDHAEFVRRRVQHKTNSNRDTSGEIVTMDGTVVGRHDGLEGFTIGQRKGLGIAFGEPRYVVKLEADSRRVVVGTRDELARSAFTANRANWLIEEPRNPFACHVQIRYNSSAVPATVTPLSDGRFEVTLHEPRHGVAPGQAAVCYSDDRVLGGGWIETADCGESCQ